jgi:outer membrane receptor protein involved in Fe transport
MVDARAMNAGKLDVESIDARLDWSLPLAGGMLRSYGAAAWSIRDTSWGLLSTRDERGGYRDGPLKWRANGGLEWAFDRTLIGANLQYFSRYRITTNEALACCSQGTERLQGSRYVKSQTYLDLYASRRFNLQWAGKERAFGIDIGLVNLFDVAPPYDALNGLIGATPMYSPYGDPRRRRFELTLNAYL